MIGAKFQRLYTWVFGIAKFKELNADMTANAKPETLSQVLKQLSTKFRLHIDFWTAELNWLNAVHVSTSTDTRKQKTQPHQSY